MGGFRGDIEKFREKTLHKLDLSLRRTAIDIGIRIIFRTPVDTGLARNNWMPSVGTPSTETTPYKGKTGAAVRARLVSTVGQWKPVDGASFFFTNNLAYIVTLERGGYPNPPKRGSWNKKTRSWEIKSSGGYSLQAPRGMVAITVAEFENIVDASIRGI